MLNGNILLALPVFIPMMAGVLQALIGLKGKSCSRIFIAIITITNAFLVMSILIYQQGSSLVLFYVLDKIPVILQIDLISVFFTGLISIIWAGVTIYSFAYIKPGKESNRYYAFLTGLLGAMIGIGFSGNIITFYLFYEMMTFLSFPLICHSMNKEDIKAAINYLIYSVFGATLVLVGIAYLSATGTITSFISNGTLDVAILNNNRQEFLLITFLMIIGFSCKAGMFPLHAWLPVAHPAAPAPFSALLSGLITKAGVIGIIRVVYYIVGLDFLKGTWVQALWMSCALVTVFMGSMLAFREPLLKKRLAYSSNSQISYILFGLSIMSYNGLTASLLQLFFHAFAKTTLFLCAGAIIQMNDLHYIDELKGIGKKMPIVMCCFTIASLSLIGIPPFGGFISKWHLITAALEAPIGSFSFIGPITLLISALLTAGYLLPIIISGFFPGVNYDYDKLVCKEPGKLMTFPLIFLVSFSTIYAIFPSSLISLFDGIIKFFL